MSIPVIDLAPSSTPIDYQSLSLSLHIAEVSHPSHVNPLTTAWRNLSTLTLDRITTLEAQLDDLVAEVYSLREANATHLEDTSREIARLKAQNSAGVQVKWELQQLLHRRRQSENDRAYHAERLKREMKTNLHLRKQVEGLKKEVQNLQVARGQKGTTLQVHGLQRAGEKYRSDIVRLMNDKETMSKDYKSLSEKVHRLQYERRELGAKDLEYQGEIQRLKFQRDEMQGDINRAVELLERTHSKLHEEVEGRKVIMIREGLNAAERKARLKYLKLVVEGMLEQKAEKAKEILHDLIWEVENLDEAQDALGGS